MGIGTAIWGSREAPSTKDMLVRLVLVPLFLLALAVFTVLFTYLVLSLLTINY